MFLGLRGVAATIPGMMAVLGWMDSVYTPILSAPIEGVSYSLADEEGFVLCELGRSKAKRWGKTDRWTGWRSGGASGADTRGLECRGKQ